MTRGPHRRGRELRASGGSVRSVSELLERSRQLPPQIADGLLGLVLFASGLVGLYGPVLIDQPYREPDVLAFALIGLQTLPLAWRRTRPGTALALTGLSGAAYLVLEYLPTNALLGPLIAVYSMAAHATRFRKVAITVGLAVLSFVLLGGVFVAQRVELTWEVVTVNYLFFAAAWLIGDNVRVRRQQSAALEARARRLENERDERARRAVAEERARIARELHDVVAHNVSVMVVQAGAARRRAERDPAAAVEAITGVERVGRQALDDMRRLLGVLRTGDEDEEALAPQPGLAQVPTLVEQLRDAGLDVTLRVDGETRHLPPGIDLTAYRIVQEALTNVLKHAGDAATEVTVRRDERGLEIEVLDDGRGAASELRGGPDGGQGLVGMRERVTLFNGELDIGPRPGGGYRVHARLPLTGEAADPRSGGVAPRAGRSAQRGDR